MVTSCGIFQLEFVKMSVGLETLASLMFSELILKTTFSVGRELRTIVKASVSPFSVTNALLLDRVKPAWSSSLIVSEAFCSPYSFAPFPPVIFLISMIIFSFSSSIRSSIL